MFQAGVLATAGDAYITIPGAYVGIYGGGTLSDDTGPTAETTSGTVHAYGKPLTIRVNTYGVDASSTLGKYLSQNTYTTFGNFTDKPFSLCM